MVGVAGKSKGCKTCRQRKIACGLQRPQCLQCVKSNRVCLGYERERIFVPVQPTAKDKKTVMKSSFDEIKKTASTNRESTATAGVKRDSSHGALTRYAAPGISAEILSNATYRQHLLNAFVASCISGEQLGPNARHWLMLLPDFLMRTKALETSSMAISAAALGRIYGDPVLVRESLKLYTRGLRELQKALWNPKLMYDDEVLAACLALSMYEIMECPAEAWHAYAIHCKGFLRLVQLRGVDAHTSGIAHELFVGLRTQGILFSLEAHHPTFLSDPPWMQGPWKDTPKRLLDRLVDCLAVAPGIIKQSDGFKNLRSKQLLDSALDIVRQCWQLDAALQGIYEDLKEETSGPLYWSVLSEEDNPADDPKHGKVFPVAFQFSDLKMAGTLMMYWAITVMLWSGLCSLYQFIATIEMDPVDAYCPHYPNCRDDTFCRCRNLILTPSGSLRFNPSKLPPLGHRIDFMTPACNVCQSVEYCLKSPMMIAGVFAVSAPLNMVFETVRHNPGCARETAWMKATLEKIQNKGVRILKYYHEKSAKSAG
ncbi:hypothetical protein VTN77DRAFT_5173 [Rasamsonia byssochlamydoides]|uniref:uncharacterized protein n=1 Tax=Rasamsonia byssochlamydoides TaxID=89139 RepID=UPI003743BA66